MSWISDDVSSAIVSPDPSTSGCCAPVRMLQIASTALAYHSAGPVQWLAVAAGQERELVIEANMTAPWGGLGLMRDPD